MVYVYFKRGVWKPYNSNSVTMPHNTNGGLNEASWDPIEYIIFYYIFLANCVCLCVQERERESNPQTNSHLGRSSISFWKYRKMWHKP